MKMCVTPASDGAFLSTSFTNASYSGAVVRVRECRATTRPLKSPILAAFEVFTAVIAVSAGPAYAMAGMLMSVAAAVGLRARIKRELGIAISWVAQPIGRRVCDASEAGQRDDVFAREPPRR